MTQLTRNGSQDHKIHSDTIYDIAFENDRIWLGSYGNGLACGERTTEGWHFKKTHGQPANLKIRNILPIGDGTLLIGTADGLVTTDAGRSAAPRYAINKYRSEEWGLKGNDIMSVVESGGRYYACVFGSGISRIDSDSLLSDSIHFTNYQLPTIVDTDRIMNSVADANEIWVIASGSLTRFSTQTGAMTTFPAGSFDNSYHFPKRPRSTSTAQSQQAPPTAYSHSTQQICAPSPNEADRKSVV